VKILRNVDGVEGFSRQKTLWFYNGLDCCITKELQEIFTPTVAKVCQKTYDFEMAMLGPAMTMMRRGLRVDKEAVPLVRAAQVKRQKTIIRLWNYITEALVGERINYASSKQVPNLFYNLLGIPPIHKREGGRMRVTTDRGALEKIAAKYPRGKVLARILLELRDIKKKLDVVEVKLDPDGRLHYSFNVAGTNTWRWSSSATAFRTGTNVQNITKELRRMYIPDEGYKMFYVDLDQAESLAMAYTTGDKNYIFACHSGDLHTAVAKMIWSELPWTEDIIEDRGVAETPYLHGLSYRDLAKRAGHGTNYGLTPHSLASHLGLKLRDAFKFHLQYLGGVVPITNVERWHNQDPDGGFDLLIDQGRIRKSEAGEKSSMLVLDGAFPDIRKYHKKVLQELEVCGKLTTPLGMTRHFWGNPSDQSVVREAIAFVPQSTIGCLLHIGMYRVWKELDGDKVQILANIHDAILGQAKEEDFDNHLQAVIDCMLNPIPFGESDLLVPVSAEVGYNWSPVDPKNKLFEDGNPNGLREWNGEEE